jgi:outer membrane protein assembly factor BamB
VQTDTANPAQAGDVVYQGARAIDAATGNVLWDRSSIFGFSVVDAVSGGAVYLAQESGGLVALDAVSGHVRWEANGPGTLLASPTVVGGLVYGMDSNGIVSAYPTACSTPCDPVWTIDLGNDQESLAYADGTIYAVSNGAVKNTGTLYALDATTGHVVWSTTQVGLADTAPVVVRGIVYAGEGRLSTGYSIAAYPASCSTPCQAILRIPVTGAIGSFAVAHGSIYATVGGTSLYAFDATSGATLWHGSIGTQGGSPGYPAVANGVVYKTGNDGHLYAFDAASGENLLALDIQHCGTSCGGSFYATPAISQGSVYVRGGDGVLHALRLSSAR